MIILKRIFVFLIIVWLGISIYLSYTHYTDSSVFCGSWVENSWEQVFKIWKEKISSCDKVLNSEYSKMFWIPISVFWIIFYLWILWTYILFQLKNIKYKKEILLLFTFIWACFSIYFSYLQYFVIHWFCYYCLTSAFITYVLFWISLYFYKKWWK